jgi:hypothetical protein
VFFSHGKHYNAKLECATCHGNVLKQEKITLFRPTTMKACIDCHKETKATLECNSCHELSQ